MFGLFSVYFKLMLSAPLGTMIAKRMQALAIGQGNHRLAIAGIYLYYISFTVGTVCALMLIWRSFS